MHINFGLLKKLMSKGVVQSIYSQEMVGSSFRNTQQLSESDIDSMKYDDRRNISIQQAYNYSEMKQMNFVCSLTNYDSKVSYSMIIPADHLKDLLELVNWDYNAVSPIMTVKLFNKLLHSPEGLVTRSNQYQDVVSKTALSQTHDYTTKEKLFYTVHGTHVDSKIRFETLEEVYNAVNKVAESEMVNANETDDFAQ